MRIRVLNRFSPGKEARHHFSVLVVNDLGLASAFRGKEISAAGLLQILITQFGGVSCHDRFIPASGGVFLFQRPV